MPNYSMNSEGQKPQPPQQIGGGQPGISDPKSIRDYLAIAKEGAARFTNRPESAGPGTHFMPEAQPAQGPAQAISDQPQSEYEMIPFSQRVEMSPYIRAQERVKTMLPELWNQMFPGYQQGAILNEQEMKQWNGGVEALTAQLLKQFDAQYGEAQKVKKASTEQRGEDQRYWQKFYHTQKQKGQPIIDPEGMPVSEADYVRERMSAADEIRIKDGLRSKEGMPKDQGITEQYSMQNIGSILKRNPELKRQMLFQIKNYLEQTLGQLDDRRFGEAMRNPEYKGIRDEAIKDTLEQYSDELRNAAGNSQEE